MTKPDYRIFFNQPWKQHSPQLLKDSSIVLIFAALVLLLSGLAFFDFSVARSEYSLSEFSHYGPGDPLHGFKGKIHGFSKDRRVLIRDLFGAVVETNLKQDGFRKNQAILLNGILESRGQLFVESMEVYPYRFWKYFVSFLTLLFVIWKVLQEVKFTRQGLCLRSEPESSGRQ